MPASEGRVYLISIISSVAFAVMYAQVELWVSWERVLRDFSFLPSVFGVTPYNLLFTTLLYLLVAFGPLMPVMGKKAFAVGLANFLLICVVEDASYFLLSGRWITQADYTARILGTVSICGILVPTWYLIYLIFVLALYSRAVG